MFVLTEKNKFYRIDCEERTLSPVEQFENDTNPEDLHDMQDENRNIKTFACGSDFVCTLTDSRTLYAMGSNAYGQLGQPLNVKSIDRLSCVESLAEVSIEKVFAGAR